MIKNIAAFGDSWIYGDEIKHPDPNATEKEQREYREANCIVGQLGKLLGLTVENYGVPGGSLKSTVWEFHHWLTDEHRHTDSTPQETLVVVGLTSAQRMSWWNNNNYKHSAQYLRREFEETKHQMSIREKQWYEHIKFQEMRSNQDELHHIRYWQTTEFFYNWCKTNGSKLLMFNVFQPPFESNLVANPTWAMWEEIMDKPELRAAGNHPNEQGSRYLAKMLEEMIDD